MRTVLTIAISALLFAACASQPKSTPSAAAAAPAAAAVAPVASAAPASGAKHVAGYVRVVKGGVIQYCRDDLQTGSHLMVKTTCLSEQEYNALADDTRRDVERIRSTMSGMH